MEAYSFSDKPSKAQKETTISASMSTLNFGSSSELQICERKTSPYEGAEVRKILISTNYLAIKFSKLGFAIHYDVVIQPSLSKRLFRAVMEEFRLRHYPNRYPAFDGKSNLYSSSKLPFEAYIEDNNIRIMDNDRELTFTVTIKFVAITDLSVINKYFQSKENRYLISAQEAVQCINVALKSAHAINYISSGNSFFIKPHGKIINLGNGMEMYHGFYQSVVLGWKPFLNIDTIHRAFSKNQPVIDLIQELCPTANLNLPLTSVNFKIVDRFLSSLKVTYQFPNQPFSKRGSRVHNLDKPANEAYFKNTDGEEISVANYFLIEKCCPLRYPAMPCLWVGSKIREPRVLIPAEFCVIQEGQTSQQRLSSKQLPNFIKAATAPTNIRKNKIMNLARIANLNENPCAQEFGISISQQFTEISAKVLDPPSILYKNTNIKPEKGAWRPAKFYEGKHLENWGLICLDASIQIVQKFVDEIIYNGKPLGMYISKPRVMIPIKLTRGREQTELKQYFQRYKYLDLLFIIIPNENNYLYGCIKQTAELQVGTLTQCICRKTIERLSPSTVKNILLKVNAKLNGINHSLNIRPSCLERPCTIMGADVTHPLQKRTTPSVAAVTASFDPQGFRYQVIWRLQPPMQEIITDLAAIVKEHLINFYVRNHSVKPERIIFFRDGVSEGQFQMVLNEELSAIRKACFALQPDGTYKPKITFFVVMKRHHTRFFPTDPKDVIDKNGNVPVGTCIDTQITHPVAMDFYLLSHKTAHGTARPTKYSVLWDDSNMSEYEIEKLAFHLCYTFSRCTSSVSYPTPTFYAHLAAARAKVYCENKHLDLENLEQEQQKICRNGNLMKDLPMFFV